MDFINKITDEAGRQLGQNQGDQSQEGGLNQNNSQQHQQSGANPPATSNQQEEKVASGFMGSFGGMGGIGDKLNAAAGGGKESEKNEDLLDKGTLLRDSGSWLFCPATVLYYCLMYNLEGDMEKRSLDRELT